MTGAASRRRHVDRHAGQRVRPGLLHRGRGCGGRHQLDRRVPGAVRADGGVRGGVPRVLQAAREAVEGRRRSGVAGRVRHTYADDHDGQIVARGFIPRAVQRGAQGPALRRPPRPAKERAVRKSVS